MLPPIEQVSYELGSGGYQSPCAAAAALTSALSAPASTRTVRVAGSTVLVRIRSVDRVIASRCPDAPPESPVPAPRGTTATPWALAQRSVATTWSVLSARTQATGGSAARSREPS